MKLPGVADGFQIEVTKTAAEAGISIPVFITRGVYDQCVAVPLDSTGRPIAGSSGARDVLACSSQKRSSKPCGFSAPVVRCTVHPGLAG